MYTLLYLKWKTKRTYCIAQGTLLKGMQQPRWEGSLGKNGYMYCVWLSPFAVHLKLPQHCSLTIFQHKIQRFFFLKKRHRYQRSFEMNTISLQPTYFILFLSHIPKYHIKSQAQEEIFALLILPTVSLVSHSNIDREQTNLVI